MSAPGKKQRRQMLLTFAGVSLAALYLLAYLPISRRVQALDEPLISVWQLLPAQFDLNAEGNLDLQSAQESLREIRRSAETLKVQSVLIEKRTALEPLVTAKLAESFQLIDFQNERQNRIEEILLHARNSGVTLDPAVLANFPKYTAGQPDAPLLWAQLAILHHLLHGALNSQVGTIHAIKLLPIVEQNPAGNLRTLLHEIPVQIVLVGRMKSVSRFLATLPLNPDEIKQLGLPEARQHKPALFIDRIQLRKQSLEKPEEVHLDLRICAFVYRSNAPSIADRAASSN